MIGIPRTLRQLAHDRRGATVIEFAMLAVPLIALLIGGLDLAHQSYVHSVLQGALNDAARRASVEDPQFTASGDTLEERVAATVQRQVRPVAPNATYTIRQSNYYDFSGIGNPEKLMTDINGNGQFDADDGDCWQDLNENGEYDLDTGRSGIGGANDVVFYEAQVVFKRVFPIGQFIGGSDTLEFNARTAIRNQPYDNQNVPPVLCGDGT